MTITSLSHLIAGIAIARQTNYRSVRSDAECIRSPPRLFLVLLRAEV